MSLHSNVASMTSQQHVNFIQRLLFGNTQRLSSGYRINSAADDAAGLAISQGMTADVRAMNVAESNAYQAYNIAQTAEAGMGAVSQSLQRMRELAVQASSDTLSASDKAVLNTEYQALSEEVGRQVNATQYNGQRLLDGTYTGKTIQVGTDTSPESLVSMDISTLETGVAGLDIADSSIMDSAQASAAIDSLDAALDTVSTSQVEIGAKMSQLEKAANHLGKMRESTVAARSRIQDTNYASETSSYAANQVLLKAGVAMLAQANAQPSLALKLLA